MNSRRKHANLTIDEAKAIALETFPKGPEAIASLLGASVERAPLSGTDGWCITHPARPAKIRINSNAVVPRQRFTLAHEIAHLLLGTPPEIVSNSVLPFESVRTEERNADRLASELLIPLEHMRPLIQSVPVDAQTVKRLAKAAEVSEIVAAARIVAEARSLGIENGAIAVFKGQDFQWQWANSLWNIKAAAISIFPHAAAIAPLVFRSAPNEQGQVTTAALVGSPDYPVLLLQLLPTVKAAVLTHHETARALEAPLIEYDASFRNRINGCFGMFKPIAAKMTLDEAVRAFTIKYAQRLDEQDRQKLLSAAGQAFIRHRLAAWALRT